ncbi:hypothetical protein ACP4OV_002265 [Aristida adscensionis]
MRTDGIEGRGVPQPGEPGWFPAAPETSSSLEPGELGWLPPSLLAILRSSSSSESSGPFPPALCALLRSEPVDPFERRCVVSLLEFYIPAPPPPAPARKLAPYPKDQRAFVVRPEVILAKSKRYAKGALEYYNRRKKIKFELTDVKPAVMMPEVGRFYTHVNFAARSSKKGSQEKLFFAELLICGKKRASSRFLVSYCEALGSDSTVGYKGFQLDTPAVRKNVNFDYCFACSSRIFHPKGGRYVAGHCNIPYFYDSPYL